MSVGPVETTPATQHPTLDSLLMTTGELSELIPDTLPWTALAAELRTKYLTNGRYSPLATLCTVYHDARVQTGPLIHGPGGVATDDLTRRVVEFVRAFMTANGQLPYLEHQPWYRNGEHVVAIDLNYYPDRTWATETLMFHKDTGGNNVFVNLIFDNKLPIPATEWFADLADPGTARSAWQAKVLPPAHLAELVAVRERLRLGEHATGHVHGGVTKGTNAFVSWVDDLIWHATPTTTTRTEFTLAIAERAHTALGTNFYYRDEETSAVVLGMELINTIAECENTALRRWMTSNGLEPRHLDNNKSWDAWQALYHGTANRSKFLADVTERARTDWRILGGTAEAIAKDTNLEGGGVVVGETPAGMSGRRRANSLDPGPVEEAREANKDVPRSFIRTWVRVLPNTSTEYQAALTKKK